MLQYLKMDLMTIVNRFSQFQAELTRFSEQVKWDEDNSEKKQSLKRNKKK